MHTGIQHQILSWLISEQVPTCLLCTAFACTEAPILRLILRSWLSLFWELVYMSKLGHIAKITHNIPLFPPGLWLIWEPEASAPLKRLNPLLRILHWISISQPSWTLKAHNLMLVISSEEPQFMGDLWSLWCLTKCIISLTLRNYFTEIGALITKLIEKNTSWTP